MNVTINTVVTLTCHVLIFAQGLVLTPIVIKSSGAEVFGSFVLIFSALHIAYGFSSLGVGTIARRNLPSNRSNAERVHLFFPQFWFRCLSAFIVGIVFVLMMMMLEKMGWILPHISMVLPLLFMLCYCVFSTTADYFRYTDRIWTYNLAVTVQPYLFISLALVQFSWAGRLEASDMLNSQIFLSYSLHACCYLRCTWT